MPNFITRVELHGASNEHYEMLHEAMEARGFHRTITGGDGVTYHLPTAEYYRTAQLTGDQIRASARAAADTTGLRNAVLVTQASESWWVGLTTVR